MRLDGKTALITGAAKGIGRAIATLFAKEGARVMVNDIDTEEGLNTANAIESSGGQAIFVEADVSRSDQVEDMIAQTVGRFDGLDILVNNAAIEIMGSVPDVNEEDWDRQIEVNLKGPFLCCKYAMREMIRRGGGNIINVASQAVISVSHGVDAYIAAKTGLVGLTKAIAWTNGCRNIRANALCPGPTDTGMQRAYVESRKGNLSFEDEAAKTKLRTPLHRWATKEEIAHSALFLAADESAFMTGTCLVVDGGETTGMACYPPPDFEESKDPGP